MGADLAEAEHGGQDEVCVGELVLGSRTSPPSALAAQALVAGLLALLSERPFSRRIVGWSASTSKETQLVLDAMEMALWQLDREDRRHTPGQLIHHSDAGSQGGFNRSSKHLENLEVRDGTR